MLAGARNTTVAHDIVTGHAGADDPDTGQPAQFSLGGLAVLDAGPLTGGAAPSDDTVTRYLIIDNQPFDVLYDGSGTGNRVTGNLCASSAGPGVRRAEG